MFSTFRLELYISVLGDITVESIPILVFSNFEQHIDEAGSIAAVVREHSHE